MSRKDLDELCDIITVLYPADRPEGAERWPEGHYAICDDNNGAFVFTPFESLAFKIRMDLIAMRLNSQDCLKELDYDHN